MFRCYCVYMVFPGLRFGVLNLQKSTPVFAKLKSNPGIFFAIFKNDNFLPRIISRPTLQPALSVLFHRLFTLNSRIL